MDNIEIETTKLFDLCDQDKKGYLTADDLRAVCPQLDEDEIQFIFQTLDTDGSGRIDRKEFLGGFQNVVSQGERQGFREMKRRLSVIEVDRSDHMETAPMDLLLESLPDAESVVANLNPEKVGEDIYHSDSEAFSSAFDIPCQDEVLKLYEQLQEAGTPKLLRRFEKVVSSFCKEIKEQKDQNIRLQYVFESERESYHRRMNEVESEIDQQISQTEKRAREEERIKLTREKEDMRMRLEAEMSELRANIARMQLLEKTVKLKHETSLEVKEKLRGLSLENQTLKAELADSNLELAIIKSELATIRTDYEAKKDALMSDTEDAAETIRQTEKLQRQLQLLYDANKRLHDTNDSLREALDQRTRSNSMPSDESKRIRGRGFSATSSHSQQPLAYSSLGAYTSDEDADSGLALKYDGYISSDHESVRSISNIRFERGRSRDAPDELHPLNSTPDRTFRVVMCGDPAVGKTSLVTRIIKKTFNHNLPSTLGVDFHVKAMKVDGKNVAIQLWDTAGQERFRSLCKSYFRRADGAVLVYDCTMETTFVNIREWIHTIKESTNRTIPIMLCGNKIDLRDSRADGIVTTEEGQELSKSMGVHFAECSALDGRNVENALENLTRELMATEDVEVISAGVILMGGCENKKKSGCCARYYN